MAVFSPPKGRKKKEDFAVSAQPNGKSQKGRATSTAAALRPSSGTTAEGSSAQDGHCLSDTEFANRDGSRQDSRFLLMPTSYPWLRTKQAAQVLGISVWLIQKNCREGVWQQGYHYRIWNGQRQVPRYQVHVEHCAQWMGSIIHTPVRSTGETDFN